MNTTALALLTLSTLLLALTTKLPLASAERVLDLNGDPVVPGKHYYAVSAIRGAGGGGLYYGETGNSTCPVSVLQHGFDVEDGDSVVFQPLETRVRTICTDTPLEISFADKVRCAESSKWIVVDNSWVGIGGSKDHPGQKLQSGGFKIQKYGPDYGFAFCASGRCHNTSINYDIDRRLDLTDHTPTISFVFIKAGDN